MFFQLPGATRVEVASLFAVIAAPALAGFGVAATLLLLSPEVMADKSWAVFALNIVKLCYLGTAAAQLGRWIAEQTDGGPGNPAWWRGDHDDLPAPPVRADATAAWAPFPNALDASLLAVALTTLANRLG